MPDQFQIEPQEKSEWCWAAVALSIEKYFNSDSTLKQCQIANRVLDKRKCCTGEDDCNQTQTLIKALQKINRLRSVLTRQLIFEEITQELDAGRPVCARIEWKGGGAHFVVLTGYEIMQSGARHVDVVDPLYPSSTLDYDQFRASYHGDGTWVDTCLVTDSSKNW